MTLLKQFNATDGAGWLCLVIIVLYLIVAYNSTRKRKVKPRYPSAVDRKLTDDRDRQYIRMHLDEHEAAISDNNLN